MYANSSWIVGILVFPLWIGTSTLPPVRVVVLKGFDRDVAWSRRGDAPVLLGGDAGELAEFAAEVCLVAVAGLECQAHPVDRGLGFQALERAPESQHPRIELWRQPDLLPEHRDEGAIAVAAAPHQLRDTRRRIESHERLRNGRMDPAHGP